MAGIKGRSGVYKRTKTHNKKISDHHKGKKYALGHKHTDEAKEKMSNARKNEKHWNWKGGKLKSNGRWFIKIPNHPFVDASGYFRRSRLIAEKCLGRYLTKIEIIHHINEIKDDDRPKNLYLFKNKAEHTQYHFSKNKLILKSNLLIRNQ